MALRPRLATGVLFRGVPGLRWIASLTRHPFLVEASGSSVDTTPARMRSRGPTGLHRRNQLPQTCLHHTTVPIIANPWCVGTNRLVRWSPRLWALVDRLSTRRCNQPAGISIAVGRGDRANLVSGCNAGDRRSGRDGERFQGGREDNSKAETTRIALDPPAPAGLQRNRDDVQSGSGVSSTPTRKRCMSRSVA